MSYATLPEPKRYWHILWRDGSISCWDAKLWSVNQIAGLSQMLWYALVNDKGIPIP